MEVGGLGLAGSGGELVLTTGKVFSSFSGKEREFIIFWGQVMMMMMRRILSPFIFEEGRDTLGSGSAHSTHATLHEVCENDDNDDDNDDEDDGEGEDGEDGDDADADADDGMVRQAQAATVGQAVTHD